MEKDWTRVISVGQHEKDEMDASSDVMMGGDSQEEVTVSMEELADYQPKVTVGINLGDVLRKAIDEKKQKLG